MSSVEIELGLAEFKRLLSNGLPLKQGRCDIPLGDNMAEVTTARRKRLSGEELDHVLDDIKNALRKLPHKVEKADIVEPMVE